MSVDKDTVLRIAKLARIAMDDAQAAGMEAELNALLAWVEQLSEVDCENVSADDERGRAALADARGRRHRWRLCRRPDEERAAIRRAISSWCPRSSSDGIRIRSHRVHARRSPRGDPQQSDLRPRAGRCPRLGDHIGAPAQRVHHRDARPRVVRRGHVGQPHRAARRPSARRPAARRQGPLLHQGRPHHGREAASWTISFPPTSPRSRAICGMRAR